MLLEYLSFKLFDYSGCGKYFEALVDKFDYKDFIDVQLIFAECIYHMDNN